MQLVFNSSNPVESVKRAEREDKNMKEKLYTCYETEQTMSKKEWEKYYSSNIDKTEYKDFSEWWHDMRKSGVIEEV